MITTTTKNKLPKLKSFTLLEEFLKILLINLYESMCVYIYTLYIITSYNYNVLTCNYQINKLKFFTYTI